MNRRTAIGLTLAVLVSAGSALAAEPSDAAAKAKPAPALSYQISNQKYGDLLRPEDANSANGTRIVLYPAQAWKCMTWKLHPAGEAAFYPQNHFTSKTFSAAAQSGTAPQAVTQVPFAKEAGERPIWNFTKLPNGTYKITDAKSGKALTAVKAEDSSTVRVTVQDWRDAEEQKWKLNQIDPKTLTM